MTNIRIYAFKKNDNNETYLNIVETLIKDTNLKRANFDAFEISS